MRRVAKGLYALESTGFVNAYIIEGVRGFTLVDTGHARCVDAVTREIESSGFGLHELEQIVLTHWHFDHAGGAAGLMRRRRVKVLAHPDDIPFIKGKARPRPRGLADRASRLAQRWWFASAPLETVLPAKGGDHLRLLPNWQVLDTPGHTPGSISLFQPTQRVLLCGDALSNRGGKLRLPPAAFTQDPALGRQSAKRLAQLGVETLCCGHGPAIPSGACLAIDGLFR
ncbi:MAG: MBL fold metallo-hydrolase [Elusimicrobia bacterium]|nr:MBL fold metallo-hydrolase [Elusimicrobiota bacterium]